MTRSVINMSKSLLHYIYHLTSNCFSCGTYEISIPHHVLKTTGKIQRRRPYGSDARTFLGQGGGRKYKLRFAPKLPSICINQKFLVFRMGVESCTFSSSWI